MTESTTAPPPDARTTDSGTAASGTTSATKISGAPTVATVERDAPHGVVHDATIDARQQWSALSQALVALRSGGAVASFAALARDSQALRRALPARYDEVLQGLVDRLESAALFTEESCSFSQKDLIDSLQLWLNKADGQLG
jgi:hypothetical protein